ncbi:MAG: YciI family protein [Acidimicrobiia bacterium]|nr:YciI family protein [Acidimicrobiia bacterium]
MKYALLLYSDESITPDFGTPEMDAEMQEWEKFTIDLTEAGKHLGGEALHPSPSATTVRVRDGKTVTTDGPFAETKEALGGFYLIEADNLDDATEWALKIPNVGYGTVEIRPIVEFG